MSAASIIGLSYKGKCRPGGRKKREKKKERRIVSWRCRKICGIDGNARAGGEGRGGEMGGERVEKKRTERARRNWRYTRRIALRSSRSRQNDRRRIAAGINISYINFASICVIDSVVRARGPARRNLTRAWTARGPNRFHSLTERKREREREKETERGGARPLIVRAFGYD
jgi:hypothetical protein